MNDNAMILPSQHAALGLLWDRSGTALGPLSLCSASLQRPSQQMQSQGVVILEGPAGHGCLRAGLASRQSPLATRLAGRVGEWHEWEWGDSGRGGQSIHTRLFLEARTTTDT